MDKSSLVSIVVPIYKVEAYLPKCLESILNQNYSNIEVICVNDESPDQSLELLNEYSQKDTRVKVINQKNQGVSAARTRGLKEAKGDWILFVDGDDWIETDTCEKALFIALDQQVDIVIWGYKKEFENRSEQKQLFTESTYFDLKEYNELQRRVLGLYGAELADPAGADSMVTVWGKLYRAELIRDIEFVDLKVIGTAEDALFNLEAFGKAKAAYYLNDIFYHYRKNNAVSVTSGYRAELANQWSILFQKMAAFIPNESNSSIYQSALQNRIALSIVGIGLNECNSKKGIIDKVSFLNDYLSSDSYTEAIAQLQIKYMPLHWKVFFFCCKNKISLGVYVLLMAIRKIINR
nr:glycosyltransferase family 2 protein [uncultured Carboxylicivirga sp.]